MDYPALDRKQYKFPPEVPKVGSVIQISMRSRGEKGLPKAVIECPVVGREVADKEGSYLLRVLVPRDVLPIYRTLSFSNDRGFRIDPKQWSLFVASGHNQEIWKVCPWDPDDLIDVFIISRPL